MRPLPLRPKPRSAIFKTAEHAVGGDLRGFLQENRDAGRSYNDISTVLVSRGVLVTYETVRAWCRRLGVA